MRAENNELCKNKTTTLSLEIDLKDYEYAGSRSPPGCLDA